MQQREQKPAAAEAGLFRCPVYKKCGGCQLDVRYDQQLSYKQRLAAKLLGRYGKVQPILGMEAPLHYRCKVSVAFGYSRGQVISGIWQSSGGRLVRVEDCALEDPRAGEIVRVIRDLLPRFDLRTYDERSGRGFLRFVTVRIGKQTGEILLALGTGPGKFPGKGDFVRALTKACPQITTVVQYVSTDRRNLVLGSRENVLYGRGTITDTLCGYAFQISGRSFFQVNPLQTERLYRTAVDFAALSGSERVVDAYCGVGTIGILASAGAREVLAVETVADAVKNARVNAALNGIENLQVCEADAGEYLQQLAEAGEQVDVVFTDPPRAGCSRQFLEALKKLKPEKIVYISCNVETQARDLAVLTARDYEVRRIQPVDMFPYTRHVECVALLVRKTAAAI